MEAIEQELVEKLNNLFSFSFKVKFQELKPDDIFEVYRFVILVRFFKHLFFNIDKRNNSKCFLDVWPLLDRQRHQASSRVILNIIWFYTFDFLHYWCEACLVFCSVWNLGTCWIREILLKAKVWIPIFYTTQFVFTPSFVFHVVI